MDESPQSSTKLDGNTTTTTEASSQEMGGVSEFDIPTAAELDNLNKNNISNSKNDKEDEDVPSDFFDDFLNQDFMAGLDVVDAWDAEEDGDENNTKADNKTKYDSKSEGELTDEMSTHSSRNSSDRKEKKNEDNMKRRDPDKTKRDIQRDKDKCAKDREVKLINEKLKVVETGLVPPGTEMEVDLTEIQQKTKKDKLNAEGESKGKRSKEKRRSKSRSRGKIYERMYEYRLSRSRSRDHMFPRLRSRSRSSHRYLRERKRSRSRSHHRSDVLDKLTKRVYTSPGKERSHRKDKSPDSNNRRDWRYFSNVTSEAKKRHIKESSLESNTSERERWLRNRHRSREKSSRSKVRNRSASRRSLSTERLSKRTKKNLSKSPSRKKGKSFLEELDAKLSKNQFFKEIHQKLNSTSIPPNPPILMQPNIVPHPLQQDRFVHEPCMVPNPLLPQYQPPPPPTPYYDEQFFIGQPMPNMYNFQPNEFNTFPNVNQTQISIPNSVNTVSNEKESLEKLLAEKKISLTDYLQITANTKDTTNPANMQNKIRVISRCQDAIKELLGEVKREFYYVKSNRVIDKPVEVKYQSPLKKQPAVRFNFTTPQKSTEESLFSKSIQKLMGALKINNKESTGLTVAVQPRISVENVVTNVANVVLNKVTKNTQTDKFSCEECVKRHKKKGQEQYTQTISTMTFNVATQVTIEELEKETSSPIDILKKKSLAYLTPAELLGQTKMKMEPVEYSPVKQPLLDDKRYQRDPFYRSFDDYDIVKEERYNVKEERYNVKEERFNNVNVKPSLLGTPPLNMDFLQFNPSTSGTNLRPNPYSGIINNQNFGNPSSRMFNPSPPIKPNFGFTPDRRF